MSFETAMREDIENTLGCELHPVQLPDPITLPAATYQLIDEVRVTSHQGDSGLPTRRIQINIYAMSYAVASQLDDQLVARYTPGRGTYGQMVVEKVLIGSGRDDIDPTTGRFTRMRDLRFTYKES